MELTNIRYIVKPVSDPRVYTQTQPPFRHSHKRTYVKASQRWWVELRFHSDIDVAIFEASIQGSGRRLIEFQDTFYLEDPQLKDTDDIDAPFQYAGNELLRLNGAIKVLCPEFVPPEFASSVELFPDGHGQSIVAFDRRVHGTNEYDAVTRFLEQAGNAFNGRVLALAAHNTDVHDALYYLGLALGPAVETAWANLYKACEVMEDFVGGQKQVVDMGWCSNAMLERFHRTANHQEAIGAFSRHARNKTAPPPNPMTLAEAQLFITRLLRLWIERIIAATDAPEQPDTKRGPRDWFRSRPASGAIALRHHVGHDVRDNGHPDHCCS